MTVNQSVDVKQVLRSLVTNVKANTGLSQEDQCKQINYAPNAISDMLSKKGKVSPSFIELYKKHFADYIGNPNNGEGKVPATERPPLKKSIDPVSLNLHTINKLLDQNDVLIRSNAEAISGNREAIANNKVLAETNRKLSDRILEQSTAPDLKENHEVFQTTLFGLREFVLDGMVGTKYKTREEAERALLNKLIPSEPRRKPVKDTQKDSDIPRR